MKIQLAIILLLCCTVASRAQDLRLASAQTIPVNLAAVSGAFTTPQYVPDFPRDPWKKRKHPKGTIGLCVGVGLLGLGAWVLSNADGDGAWAPLALIVDGAIVTTISGIVMIVDLSGRQGHRYGVVLKPNGLGLAYNF